MPVLRHIVPKHRSAKVPKVPSPRGWPGTLHHRGMPRTEGTQLMGKTHPEEGELKSIYLTRIRLTKKKKRMCEQHSQAPPTLASPKLERGREKGALRLICEHELPSPLVQRYPEPTRERGKELLCDGAMSCGEAQSKECPTVDVPTAISFNRRINLTCLDCS